MDLKENALVFVRKHRCWGVVISLSPLIVDAYGKAGRIGVEQNDLLITECMCPEGQKSPNFPKTSPKDLALTDFANTICECQGGMVAVFKGKES